MNLLKLEMIKVYFSRIFISTYLFSIPLIISILLTCSDTSKDQNKQSSTTDTIKESQDLVDILVGDQSTTIKSSNFNNTNTRKKITYKNNIKTIEDEEIDILTLHPKYVFIVASCDNWNEPYARHFIEKWYNQIQIIRKDDLKIYLIINPLYQKQITQISQMRDDLILKAHIINYNQSFLEKLNLSRNNAEKHCTSVLIHKSSIVFQNKTKQGPELNFLDVWDWSRANWPLKQEFGEPE